MKYIVGIDLGATNIKIGLLNDAYKIISRIILPTSEFKSPYSLINTLISNIHKLTYEYRHKVKAESHIVLGIGIGVPGLVDFKKGSVHYLPNIKGWFNVHLKKIIEGKTGIPAFIDNDANLMALAETRLGAAYGYENVIGITLGTGVGGGIILSGRLYRGTDYASGEVGHIPVNMSGPRCNCGGTACLERYIGNKYLLEEAKKLFNKNVSLEELSRLAFRNDVKAVQFWKIFGEYLGVGLTSVVNLLNPQVIVIGGGISNAGRVIFKHIRSTIKKRAMYPQVKTVRIKQARLGNDAGIIGAGILVKESL